MVMYYSAPILESATKLVEEKDKLNGKDMLEVFSILESAILDTFITALYGGKFIQNPEPTVQKEIDKKYLHLFENLFRNIHDIKGQIEISLSEVSELAKKIYSASNEISESKLLPENVVAKYVSEVFEFLSKNNYLEELTSIVNETAELRDLFLVESGNDIDKASKSIVESAQFAALVGLTTLGAPEFRMLIEACRKGDKKAKKTVKDLIKDSYELLKSVRKIAIEL